MEIVTVEKNEKFLRRVSEQLTAEQVNSKELKHFIEEMVEMLKREEIGAGISAVQVGKHFRIFAIKLFHKDYDNPPIEVFINPEVSLKGEVKDIKEEGCLSIPEIYGAVPRYKRVRVKYINQNGEKVKQNFSGYEARVIQHENDHLDGILFTDKIVK
jgi:peptide deformylase